VIFTFSVARMVIGRLEVPVGNDEDVVGKSATTIQGVFSSPFDDEVIRRFSPERHLTFTSVLGDVLLLLLPLKKRNAERNQRQASK
jgi:hypothetical protein